MPFGQHWGERAFEPAKAVEVRALARSAASRFREASGAQAAYPERSDQAHRAASRRRHCRYHRAANGAGKVTKLLGATYIENMGGGGGTIGAAAASRAPADGYTIMPCTTAASSVISPMLEPPILRCHRGVRANRHSLRLACHDRRPSGPACVQSRASLWPMRERTRTA